MERCSAQEGWVRPMVYWTGELRQFFLDSLVGQQHLHSSPVQHNVQKDRIQSWSLDFASANATARRPLHSHTPVWGCADTCKPLHPSRAATRRPKPRPWQGCSPPHHHLNRHPDTGNLNGPIVGYCSVCTAYNATYDIVGSAARKPSTKPSYRDPSHHGQPAYAPGDQPTSSAVR
jgi:hypothetical protein